MELLSMVAPPLVGGAIGYVTNYLAIKMLFRPLKPVMAGSFRVPFTPGIVPKRKDALAAALGNAIVEKFFNADDLETVFMSDYFRNAVADGLVEQLYRQDLILGDWGREMPGREQVLPKVRDAVSVRIRDALLEGGLPELIIWEGDRMLRRRFAGSPLGKAVTRGAVSSLSDSLKEEITAYLKQDGAAAIQPFVEDVMTRLVRRPAGELTAELLPDRETAREIVCQTYAGFMRTHVRSIAESIDVSGTITEKVIQMDPAEIEDLVLTVVKRELRYVIWLGALLGVLIGAVNLFF
ncbi:hypothetical protein SDC9_76160 [bioreactor metagenome]|uniref:DUF445 domain-containing protein n=1 Tax=bioreactor metagenome TaxID=1076179 RepID=A0A644YMG4_9ZZZZ